MKLYGEDQRQHSLIFGEDQIKNIQIYIIRNNILIGEDHNKTFIYNIRNIILIGEDQ
jgi:hypothetical protein